MRLAVVLIGTMTLVAATAEAQTDLSTQRTGPGGANQAAGPSGQHPGPVGEVRGRSPEPGERPRAPAADPPPY